MLETQGYEQALDAEDRRQREAQSKRRYTFKNHVWLVVFTVVVGHDLPVQTL